MQLLAPLLAAAGPLLLAPQTTEPSPTYVDWGTAPNEEAWLWEAPGSTNVIWFLPGGSWDQDPGGFEPSGMPALLAPLFDQGYSIGLSGYDTESVFPTPELALDQLVRESRTGLGYEDVTLVGRSAGAHMALFNGIVASGDGAADRVCTLQCPAAFLPKYATFPSSKALLHFWPGASFLSQIPTQVQVDASPAYWPLVLPSDPQRRFGIIGAPKPLELPLTPLPLGQLSFATDKHAEWSNQFQVLTLQLGGWDAEFVDVYNDGQVLDANQALRDWIAGEIGGQR